uniref:Uncharacterized protein n=1 Tax=Ditylenchus dipsaci TaxID=166011 RepID=A0A915E5E7_9BILA
MKEVEGSITPCEKSFLLHYFETNLSEKIFAVSWFYDDTNLIVASTPRCLKLTDIRERSGFQASISVPTPQFGVCTEPTVGSHVIPEIWFSVFDRRYTAQSVAQIRVGMDNQNVNKLAWRKPRNKAFSMACVNKDSANFVELVISPRTFNSEVVEKQGYITDHLRQAIDNRQYQYAPLIHSVAGFNKVLSFDWHPNYTNKVALLLSSSTHQGTTKSIQIIKLVHDASSTINCNGEITFTASPYLEIARKISHATPITQQQTQARCKFVELASYFDQPDQSVLMKARINQGYGYGILPTRYIQSLRALEM